VLEAGLCQGVLVRRLVWSLAGISSTRPFFTRVISRSNTPSSGGLRSSSAELIANSVAWMRSRPAEAL
jgi:hypothetical protein